MYTSNFPDSVHFAGLWLIELCRSGFRNDNAAFALDLPNCPRATLPQMATNLPISHRAWPLFLFAFGFLLTSYPARRVDVWSHLVAGRDIGTELNLSSSVTPLFDLPLYLGFTIGGGFLVVLVKAILMGLLGIVLYNCAKTPIMRVIPAVVIGLVLLAISLRANVQPQTGTYLFLGITLFWLTRHQVVPSWRHLMPLFALFLVWANLDRGVVYGLATVALVWLGRVADSRRSSTTNSVQRIVLLLALLTGVCFLSPARFGEFPLPIELQFLVKGKWAELRSPLGLAYIRSVSDSPALMAYYPLLALSLLGFVWNRRGFLWARFLPTVALGILSALSDRAVPIFAIVAGPLASLNLIEAFARSPSRSLYESDSPWQRRLVTVLPALLAGLFLVAAWPGWLQLPPYEPRRWAFDLSTAPANVSPFLRTFKSEARESRSLHLSAESQTAFRWFCPEDDGRYDPKLVEELLKGQPVDTELRASGFQRVIVYHSDSEQLRPALNVLLRDRYRWPLLSVNGNVAIFGWRDPKRTDDLFADLAIDLTQIWHPYLELVREPVSLDGPSFAIPTWQESIRATFTEPRVTNSQNRDEAVLLVMMADVSKRWIPQINLQSWPFEQIAGLVGSAMGSPNAILSGTDAALRLNYFLPEGPDKGGPPELYQTIERHFYHSLASKDDFLPGAIAAGIRAGRRAVVENPNDARAQLALGEAYLMLLSDSRERVWSTEFKELRVLRQAQAAAALHRSVELNPTSSAKAHRLLAQMYSRIGYLDLSLEHLIEQRKSPGEKPGDSDKEYERLRDQVKALRTQFDTESSGLRIADRANLAAQMNLNGLALEILLQSDISAFGIAGLKQQLELLARTGRARQVIELSSPEQRDVVGVRSYHWLRAQAFAGLGDYTSADAEILLIAGGTAELTPDPAFLVATIAKIVGQDVLSEAPHAYGFVDTFRRMLARTDATDELRTVNLRLKNLSEVSILRGVLALEVGDWQAARRHGDLVLFFTPLRSGGVVHPYRVIGQSFFDRTDHIRPTPSMAGR